MCYFRIICHYYRLLQDILETCKQIILLCFCFSSRFPFVGVRLVMYQSAVRLVSVFPSLSVVGHFSPLFFLLCLFLDLSLFTQSSHHSCGLHRFLQPLVSLSQTFWYWLSLHRSPGHFHSVVWKSFLSTITPSTFLHAFAPACILRRTSASTRPFSDIYFHPDAQTPLPTCLI